MEKEYRDISVQMAEAEGDAVAECDGCGVWDIEGGMWPRGNRLYCEVCAARYGVPIKANENILSMLDWISTQ